MVGAWPDPAILGMLCRGAGREMDDALLSVITLVCTGLFVLVLTVVVVGIPAAIIGLIVVQTIRREGRWGMNLKPTSCPECQTPAPAFRTPKNARQAMWGGWTCERCGLELDKWGRPVAG